MIKGCRCHHQSKNVGFKTNWRSGMHLEWNEFNELEFNCIFFPLSCIKWQHTNITYRGFFCFVFLLFSLCESPCDTSKEQLSPSEVTRLIIAGEDLWKDDTHYQNETVGKGICLAVIFFQCKDCIMQKNRQSFSRFEKQYWFGCIFIEFLLYILKIKQNKKNLGSSRIIPLLCGFWEVTLACYS